MSYRFEFILPGLPRMTNPSGRGSHWRTIRAERLTWIFAVAAITSGHRPKTPLRRAKLIFTRMSTTAPDPDGLVSGFKAVCDGLVKCGILEDDKFVNIGMPDYRWEKAPRGKGCVRVCIEETKGE